MSKKTILVIDDDPDVRSGLRIRLQATGYETFFAADAVTSVSQARKHKPDLIVLDLGLPGGDGFVVMERFKAIPDLSTIPVIIVSGRDVHANHERALKAGARAFLQKPVENSELLRAIRVALGETVEVRQLPVLELEAESIPRSAHGGATR
jgi:two-component system KDP operon response regulator KdpE